MTFIHLTRSCLILACIFWWGDSSKGTEVGPEKGSLFIVGGGKFSDELVERFFELAGGKDASIVVVPTAGGAPKYGESSGDFFRKKGATNVSVLHTHDRKLANTEAFCEPLKSAKAVWFGGGRQWRLVDAYKGTLVEKMFHDVLARGGVIGGSSAGATIQGSYLARGDTRNNQIMMGDHEEGLGFLKNTAIDQHVIARNRHFDLLNVIRKQPELLGLGVDENTAIEVKGDQFVVRGASYALVYDGQFWSREGVDLKQFPEKESLFYFLKEGDRYDLKERKVISRSK